MSDADPPITELRTKRAQGGLPEWLVELLSSDAGLVASIARFLLDEHFPGSLHDDILREVGLSLQEREPSPTEGIAASRRDPAFSQRVLRAYEYRCAVCGYDGLLLNQPVGVEAAHVRWFSHNGPETVGNGICLCSLHHKGFDLGGIGISRDHRVLVSQAFRGGTRWNEFVLAFAGAELLGPQRGQPRVGLEHIEWHLTQVFRAPSRPSSHEPGET